jgi:hypothetical protein
MAARGAKTSATGPPFAKFDKFDDSAGARNLADAASLATALLSSRPVQLHYSTTTTRVPIVASRVSLPEEAGTAQLTALLPPAVVARFFRNVEQLLRAPPQPGEPAKRQRVPKPRRLASDEEYRKLIQAMFARGMVAFDAAAPPVVNGVFGVPKDGGLIRLIIDARLANLLFADPPWVELPTPDLLRGLHPQFDEFGEFVEPPSAFVGKVDIDNYYHRLLLPEWLWRYFALPPVRASDVGLGAQLGADTLVWPCCKTLPMGWSWSVFLGQAVHLHQLECAGLRRSDLICSENDLVVDRIRHGAFIDDLFIFGTDERAAVAVIVRVVSHLCRVGLWVKQSKLHWPSCAPVDVIGVQFDGRSWSWGVAPAKLWELVADTHALLDFGFAAGSTLRQLLGSWIWACLPCRPALSVLNAAFRFVECANGRPFEIWHQVRRELSTLCALAPLLRVNLAAPWFGRVLASDASSWGQGVTVSREPSPAAQQQCARFAGWQPTDFVDFDKFVEFDKFSAPSPSPPRRASSASAVALPDSVPLGNVPAPLPMPPTTPAAELAGLHGWASIVSHEWRRHEHINVLELRALRTAVQWAISNRFSCRRRLLALSDSSVVVGAASKGRSSSSPLNRRLRSLAALLLASGIQLSVCWLPSGSNPADRPSRRHEQL